MPKINLKKANVKATDVAGKIVVLDVPIEAKKDANTGEITYNAIVVFEGEKRSPVTVKLSEKPTGVEEYDSVELHGLQMDVWAQASGGSFANVNWRATADKMTKATSIGHQGNTQSK